MIQESSARETGSAACRVKEGRWEGHGAALCPPLSPRCHSGRAPQGPDPPASRAGCCWHIPAPRGPNTSFGGACGCAGGQDGDRVSPTSPCPHDGTCQTPAAPGTGDGVAPHKATIVTGARAGWGNPRRGVVDPASPSLSSILHSHCSLPAPHSCAWPQWPLLAASPAPAALPRPLPRCRATPLAAEAEKFIPVKKKKSILAGHQLRRRTRAGHALLTSYPSDAPGFLARVGWKERDDGGVS